MQTQRRLILALVATACVAGFEFWGGAASRSLALASDAAHVCMDTFALGLALLAAIGAARPADPRRTFGYGRVEVLGALANGTLLLVATIAIVYTAVQRFTTPVEPHAATMSLVAAAGLAVNGGVGILLRGQSKRDLNVRAALFHVFGDALGAVAVILGGIAIGLTRLAWIDPLLSLFVAGIIVVGVARVMRDATEVLLESGRRRLLESCQAHPENRRRNRHSRHARLVDRQRLPRPFGSRASRRPALERGYGRAARN
jgi:cobalt-zinc-cadmium efflux system protein